MTRHKKGIENVQEKRTRVFMALLLVFCIATVTCAMLLNQKNIKTEVVFITINNDDWGDKILTIQQKYKMSLLSGKKPREIALRAVKHDVLDPILALNERELEILERCVQSEDGIGSYSSKVLVARVVINRVLSDKFPSDIESVVFQKRQFQVASNGTIWEVEVSDETKLAVQEALNTRSTFDGLYFANPKYSKASWYKWMTDNLEYVCTDEDGLHVFFK